MKDVNLHLKWTTSSEVAEVNIRERELLLSHKMGLASLVFRNNCLSPVTEQGGLWVLGKVLSVDEAGPNLSRLNSTFLYFPSVYNR